MEENKTAVNTIEPAAVQEKVIAPTEDAEAKIAALEAEKARVIEEGANWKVAAMKYKSKLKEESSDEESDDDKMRRIASETVANSRLAEIAEEQDLIIKQALKENKELKLAHLNKTDIPASTISHNEGQGVRDTLVTPEQEKAFKARGWTDKDIERYKKNYLKYGGR